MRISTTALWAAALLAASANPSFAVAKPSAKPRHGLSGQALAKRLIIEQARAVQTLAQFEVSHQVDQTVVTPKYKETTHEYLKTWIKRPHLIRVEVKSMMHGMTLVSDGSGTWVYRDASRTYARQSALPPAGLFNSAFPGLSRQLSDANLPNVMRSARLVGSEALKVGGRSYPCQLVEVTIDPNAAPGELQNNRLRLWISSQYQVPLKVEATINGSGGAGSTTYSDFVTTFLPNASIPASTWVFLPPKNSHPAPGTRAPGLE